MFGFHRPTSFLKLELFRSSGFFFVLGYSFFYLSFDRRVCEVLFSLPPRSLLLKSIILVWSYVAIFLKFYRNFGAFVSSFILMTVLLRLLFVSFFEFVVEYCFVVAVDVMFLVKYATRGMYCWFRMFLDEFCLIALVAVSYWSWLWKIGLKF